MPIFEYLCDICDHRYERLQPMSVQGSDCPRCGKPAKRVISLFAAMTAGEDGEVGSVASTGGCPACAGGSCACSVH